MSENEKKELKNELEKAVGWVKVGANDCCESFKAKDLAGHQTHACYNCVHYYELSPWDGTCELGRK